MPKSISNPITIIIIKHPFIARQVIMANQLPFATRPMNDWIQAAHDPAAIPIGLNPIRVHNSPIHSTIEPIIIPTISITSII